jgi:tRNA(Met) C34 N-acetyltransferase TmcA
MERTNMYFENDTLCKVKQVSEKQGVSSARYVRVAVEEKLTRDGYKVCGNGKQAIESMLQMAVKAEKSKSWKKAPSDLGKNHDYYVYLGLKDKHV